MDVMQLCADLCLLDGQTQESPLNRRLLSSFSSGETVFAWSHLGTVEVEVSKVVSAIRRHQELTPLRTGHLGNWDNIAERRACAVDYNSIISSDLRLGVPCIFDLNMTEADDQQDGDWIYLPGSDVTDTARRPLALRSLLAPSEEPLARAKARYVPFMSVERGGAEQMPLVAYHKQRLAGLHDFSFRYQSEIIADAQERVKELLIQALERLCSRPGADADRMLGLLFDKTVLRDGVMERLDLSYGSGGFTLSDGSRFSDAETLVDAAFFPLLAAADPEIASPDSFADYTRFPMFSGPLVAFLLAALECHLTPEARGKRPSPFTPHVHWGALGMAGYPPYKRGYFAKNVKQSRKIYELLISPDSGLPPIFFMLLPSAIFHLYTHEDHPADGRAVADLIATVRRETDGLRGKSNLIAASIRKVAADWLEREHNKLSSYFRAKFKPRRSILNDAELPSAGGALLEPDDFGRLTCLQACMIVGALHELEWPTAPDLHAPDAVHVASSTNG